MIMSKGHNKFRRQRSILKEIRKNFKKGIDKLLKVWYNGYSQAKTMKMKVVQWVLQIVNRTFT